MGVQTARTQAHGGWKRWGLWLATLVVALALMGCRAASETQEVELAAPTQLAETESCSDEASVCVLSTATPASLASELGSLGTPEPDRQDAMTEENGGDAMTFRLESPAFEEGALIPAVYTCDGRDISPPLKWSDPPEGTQSFTLICDDPDAPIGTWIHWVIYNIPPDQRDLPEGVPAVGTLPNGARQGRNSWPRRLGYGGPCPPSGTHRYVFKLYALDTMLDLEPEQADARAVQQAMQGHILAEAQLIGLYQRMR